MKPIFEKGTLADVFSRETREVFSRETREEGVIDLDAEVLTTLLSALASSNGDFPPLYLAPARAKRVKKVKP